MDPTKRETKTRPLAELKLLDGGAGGFCGYASVFDELDSDGDIVAKGAYAKTLDEFTRRGFIAWGHDWTRPVATITSAREDARGLFVEAEFHSDAQSQAARTIARERAARGKFMGLSIGYLPLEFERTDKGRRLTEIQLFETSLVTVPALASAGVTAVKSAVPAAPAAEIEQKVGRRLSSASAARIREAMATLQELLGDLQADGGAEHDDDAGDAGAQAKGAIGPHSTGTSTGSWDGPANERRLPNSAAALRRAHAWMEPGGDPEAKSTWKFGHHEVSGSGSVGAANLTACSTGIAVLNGGRSGTTIPDGDRRGVWSHLARHLRDGSREPPPLKSAGLSLLDAGEHVLADLGEYAARLGGCADDPDDALTVKEYAGGILRRLTAAKVELDGALRRAEAPGQLNPRELHRRFAELAGRYADIAAEPTTTSA